MDRFVYNNYRIPCGLYTYIRMFRRTRAGFRWRLARPSDVVRRVPRIQSSAFIVLRPHTICATTYIQYCIQYINRHAHRFNTKCWPCNLIDTYITLYYIHPAIRMCVTRLRVRACLWVCAWVSVDYACVSCWCTQSCVYFMHSRLSYSVCACVCVFGRTVCTRLSKYGHLLSGRILFFCVSKLTASRSLDETNKNKK